MQVPVFDLKRQYQQYKDRVLKAAQQVFDDQAFILGRHVEQLEQRVAAYCGARHGVGVSSGTDALICSLLAAGVGHGDEVILPAFTFIATASAVVRAGAKPVFVDIEPDTYNIDPGKIERRITRLTKAIIVVHLYGLPADMDAIMKLARAYDLTVIEDAAQAIGARYNGQAVCSIGDFGCLSFYPTKNLGGFGDGGMVLTNDADKAETLRMLRNHGQSQRYYSAICGGNFRLDALQAAILNVKLDYVDGWTNQRRRIAARYDELLGGCAGLRLPVRKKGFDSVFNQYCIALRERDALVDALRHKGVGSTIYYPIPLHLQKCFECLSYKLGDFPAAEKASQEILALPIWPELSDEEVEYVAEAVKEFSSKRSQVKR